MQIDSSVRPIGRRGKAGGGHQFAQKKAGFGMRNGRLHADADQAIGVVDGLPGVNGQLAAAVIGVAVVPDVEFGAVVDENLHDGGASLVCGAMKRDAAGVGLRIRIEAQVEKQLHGFQRVVFATTRR